jgi:chromosome segregation ATPase
MASIETGVDKLVKIIAKEKKIELGEAAKQLNVEPAVVQEWAEFLEQEGLVGVQYSLSKTFLIEKRLTKTEVEKKSKEYDSKKEAFTRRVDATLKQLESETADFESIKTQYYSLKDQIGDEIDQVKDEIEQLRHYEELKKSIDQDILKQKVDYQKTLDEVHQRVLVEEKRYSKLIDEIGEETKKLKAEAGEFSDVKREEDELTKRIDALQDIVKSVKSRLSGQADAVKVHEERLVRLRDFAETLENDIKERKVKEIEPLLKVSRDQEGRIMRIQDEIVAKVKQRRSELQEVQDQSEEIAKRFQTFFERRAKTESTIKELEKAKAEMKEELNDLIRKAKAFDLAAKGADTNAHIKDLEGKFKDFDKKKGAFATQLENLKSIIMGKDDNAAKAKSDVKPKTQKSKPVRSPAKKPVKKPAPKKTVKKSAKKTVKKKKR